MGVEDSRAEDFGPNLPRVVGPARQPEGEIQRVPADNDTVDADAHHEDDTRFLSVDREQAQAPCQGDKAAIGSAKSGIFPPEAILNPIPPA